VGGGVGHPRRATGSLCIIVKGLLDGRNIIVFALATPIGLDPAVHVGVCKEDLRLSLKMSGTAIILSPSLAVASCWGREEAAAAIRTANEVGNGLHYDPLIILRISQYVCEQ
jgi:hypothetical protein